MATVKFNDSAPVREPADRWSTAEAAELYDVASWGKGYFSVGKNGNLWVHPDKEPSRAASTLRNSSTISSFAASRCRC